MTILQRIKLPEPEFFKKVIKVALSLATVAGVLLSADTLGKTVVPDFSFVLLPWVKLICKNVVVAGLAIAAISKTTTNLTEE